MEYIGNLRQNLHILTFSCVLCCYRLLLWINHDFEISVLGQNLLSFMEVKFSLEELAMRSYCRCFSFCTPQEGSLNRQTFFFSMQPSCLVLQEALGTFTDVGIVWISGNFGSGRLRGSKMLMTVRKWSPHGETSRIVLGLPTPFFLLFMDKDAPHMPFLTPMQTHMICPVHIYLCPIWEADSLCTK